MTESLQREDWNDLERRHGIPPDTYCGLTPGEMSRLVVACHSGPDLPVGYRPVASLETRDEWIRGVFGRDADVERLRTLEQFFGSRVSRRLTLDWMLSNDDFDRAVADGLREHFPDLSEDARRVIAGNYSYSHAR